MRLFGWAGRTWRPRHNNALSVRSADAMARTLAGCSDFTTFFTPQQQRELARAAFKGRPGVRNIMLDPHLGLGTLIMTLVFVCSGAVALHRGVDPIVAGSIVILGYVIEIVGLIRCSMKFQIRPAYITWAVCETLCRVQDERARTTPDVRRQRAMCRCLERVARGLQNFPAHFAKDRDTSTWDVISERARRKAAAVRSMKMWLIMPIDTTYDDVIRRCLELAHCVAEGRWYDLPEVDVHPAPRMSAVRRAGIITLIVLGLAALVALAVLGNKSGPPRTTISMIVGVLVAGLLARVGISTTSLTAVIDSVRGALGSGGDAKRGGSSAST